MGGNIYFLGCREERGKYFTRYLKKRSRQMVVESSGVDEGAWERWLAYRKAIKKPLKAPSIEAARRKLAKFGEDQAAVVEQSIANSWQGLFPLKESRLERARTNGGARVSSYERADQRLREWAIARGLRPEDL